MYELTIAAHFDAAHRLPEYNGPCRRMHGHRWIVRARWRYEILDRQGMAYDLVILKSMLRSIVRAYDHNDLNKILTCTPTAENLARVIFERLQANDPAVKCATHLYTVSVEETPDTCVTYRPTNTSDPVAKVVATQEEVDKLNKRLADEHIGHEGGAGSEQ